MAKIDIENRLDRQMMGGWADRWMDRQADRQMDRQMCYLCFTVKWVRTFSHVCNSNFRNSDFFACGFYLYVFRFTCKFIDKKHMILKFVCYINYSLILLGGGWGACYLFLKLNL